ncbi:hypothetical protein HYDPIDRAFT_171229 [Hydnomerulius pinastri MD-312]|uniref:Uncharacterized protein n=1 Tax=Hydnomerulius pinastri MD-312 TaxID=994086 RepID=A0A0C9W6X9_9AGAM|nr:hypothetical protein HYDPIDRAFT_171229 [Hydnomerulius pinastri MD-312]
MRQLQRAQEDLAYVEALSEKPSNLIPGLLLTGPSAVVPHTLYKAWPENASNFVHNIEDLVSGNDWACNLLKDPSTGPRFVFDAQYLSKFDGESFVHFIDKPWTAGDFWNAQEFGMVKDLEVDELLIGYQWLPIVKEDQEYNGKALFVNFKNAIWHESFKKLLEVVGTMHDGPDLGYYVQVPLSHIPCPKEGTSGIRLERTLPLVDAINIDKTLVEARAKWCQKDREAILNTFRTVVRTNTYGTLLWDRVHTNHEGLNHFNQIYGIQIYGIKFTDGTKHEDISKYVFRQPEPNSNSTGSARQQEDFTVEIDAAMATMATMDIFPNSESNQSNTQTLTAANSHHIDFTSPKSSEDLYTDEAGPSISGGANFTQPATYNKPKPMQADQQPQNLGRGQGQGKQWGNKHVASDTVPTTRTICNTRGR